MAKVVLKDFFMAIIFFSLIVGSVSGLFVLVKNGGLGDGSDAVSDFGNDNKTDAFDNSFNKLTEINETSDQLLTAAQDASVDNPGSYITVGSALISSVWDGVLLVVKSAGFLNSAMVDMVEKLHLPGFVGTLLLAGIGVFFAFTFFSAILGRDL